MVKAESNLPQLYCCNGHEIHKSTLPLLLNSTFYASPSTLGFYVFLNMLEELSKFRFYHESLPFLFPLICHGCAGWYFSM